MDPTTVFILIWAGFCVYGVYLMFKGKIVLNVKGATEKKDNRTSEEKYAATKEQIDLVSRSSIGKSVEENRAAMHVRDGKWWK